MKNHSLTFFYIIFFTLNFGFNAAQAQTSLVSSALVLIPDKGVSKADYESICLKNNYLCFPQVYLQAQLKPRPVFEKLIADYDLKANDYLQNFTLNLHSSLLKEQLAEAEVRSLLLILDKLVTHSTLKAQKNKWLSTQVKLEKMLSDLALLEEATTDNFEDIYVILNKGYKKNSVSQNFLNTWQETVFVQKVSYNQILNIHSKNQTALIEGHCQTAETTLNFEKPLAPRFYFDKPCDFESRMDRTQNSISEHFEKHHMKYLTGFAVTALSYFFSTHTVVLSMP